MRADATAVRGTAGRHGGAAFAVSRTYLWVWGAMMVVLGVGSLMVNPNFGTGQDVTVGHLFGVFEVNGWHALAGLVSGIIALAFALSRRWVVLGAVYIALTSGLVPGGLFLASGDGSTAFDLIPVDYWDAITLHLVPGVIGIACVLADLVLQQRSTADLASASETRL